MVAGKKFHFIVNPKSGTTTSKQLEFQIKSYCESLGIDYSIKETEGPGHGRLLAAEASTKRVDIVFAVGGDGTVNEVASGLLNTGTTLGIIPKGSGNGLARHLGISMKANKAFQQLKNGKEINIDTISINKELCLNVAGIGFDGHIANLFQTTNRRGLPGYARLVLQEFHPFKEFEVNIQIDGEIIKTKSWVLAIANASQFGNNAIIAPMASLQDGWMDISLMQKPTLIRSPFFLYSLFSGRIHHSSFVNYYRGKKLFIDCPRAIPYHIDGEGKVVADHFSIEIHPSSLKILAPDEKKEL